MKASIVAVLVLITLLAALTLAACGARPTPAPAAGQPAAPKPAAPQPAATKAVTVPVTATLAPTALPTKVPTVAPPTALPATVRPTTAAPAAPTAQTAPITPTVVSAASLQPLSPAACAALGQGMAKTLGVAVTRTEAQFTDPTTDQTGVGCQAQAKGTGAQFKSPEAVVDALGTMLKGQGWQEAPKLAAGGPTGIAAGFRQGHQVCLAAAQWQPDASAKCPQDQPISACTVTPNQQLYTVTLNCAQSGGQARSYTDPFAYCAAVGNIAVPDARYMGQALPQSIVAALRIATKAPADAPKEVFTTGVYWRCMDGKVYACFVGANIPCTEKADTHKTPTAAMDKYCQQNPSTDYSIPAYVTGHSTVYEWRCTGGKATVVRQVSEVDAQGYPVIFWYPLTPPK